MEINTEFECYLIINDEEIKVTVKSVGDIVENYKDNSYYIDNVFVNNITDIETEEEIPFVFLNKEQKKELLDLSEEWLNHYMEMGDDNE